MTMRFVLVIVLFYCSTSCQHKQAQNTTPSVVQIDTGQLRIINLARQQAEEANQKARVLFSESNAIDTLRKYAFKEIPFNRDFSISINRFNYKKLLGIITFTNNEPYPPYIAFYFDNSLNKKSFIRTFVPVAPSPHGQIYRLNDVNNDGYKDFSYNWDKYEGSTYLYNSKTKGFEYNSFYEGVDVFYDKKLNLVCKPIWGTGGSH